MPLPSTGYLTTTIATAPGSAITDFSWLVDLSQFSGVTDFWTACTSSVGLKLRCALDSDGTELPFDVWGFDNVGATGYLRIKVPSFTGTQTLRIYPSDSGNADYATPTNSYDSSFISYNPLDGDANDRTANSNDLTLNSLAFPADEITGQLGDALDLDGTADYLSQSGNLTAGESAITVSAWVQTTAPASNRTIFGDWGGVSERCVLLRADAAADEIDVFIDNGTTFASSVNSAVLNDGVWHHVAFTWDGTSGAGTTYRNGTALATTLSLTGTINSGSTQAGRWGTRESGSEWWFGGIDELQLHSANRSAEWVAQEYSQTKDNAAFWGAGTWNAAGGGGGFQSAWARGSNVLIGV